MAANRRSRGLALHEQVGFLLGSIVRCKRLWFRNLLAPSGITPRQYAILLQLREGDGQTLNDLARRLFVDATAMSRTLSRMEKAGLVTRTRCASDRRAYEVHLTDEGKEILSRLQPDLEAAEEHMLAGLDAGRVETLKEILRTMLGNVAATDSVDTPLADSDPEDV